MGLKIYSAADPATAFSISGLFTAPLTIVQDGKYGGITQKKIYLRNDDNTLWFSGTTVLCVDTVDGTVVDGSRGINWKLSAGNTQPTDAVWATITSGNTISLANLGAVSAPDTSTYLPFWIRVQIPRNQEVQTILDVKLTINTTQNSV